MPTSGPSDETSPREFGPLILDYHPEASIELVEAARFYEERGVGLGHRFLDAVNASLDMLQRSPLLGCSDECGRRKWLIRGFPYMIIHRLQGVDCAHKQKANLLGESRTRRTIAEDIYIHYIIK